MANLFGRLFSYRERPYSSPLENFLIEALSDLVIRLPQALQIEFATFLLSSAAAARLAEAFPNLERIGLTTQVSAESKRPDIVIYVDDSPVVVIEAKVGAGLQEHEIDSAEIDEEIRKTRNQLETYALWIASETKAVGQRWPGAVVLLTAFTEPPGDFVEGRPDGVYRSVRSWKDVGDWILDNVDIRQHGVTYCDLAADLYRFLKDQSLMTKYISSRDMASAMLFVSSSGALRKTFHDLIEAVGTSYPKLRGSRRLRTDFWSDGNIYWGWFDFAKAVKRPKSKPYLAVGVCFEVPDAWMADAAKLPAHEPFFLVCCEDNWAVEKPTVFLKSIPEDWLEIQADGVIINTRPVRCFSADPDKRFAELRDWCLAEVEKLVDLIPGYEEAKTEAAPTPDDDT